MNFNIIDHTILLVIAGSRAYGTHDSESDVDIKGVAIAPKEYYFGFLNNFEQADKSSHMMKFYNYLTDEEKKKADQGELEGSIYNITKFFKLAADCNPNILDILFCRDEEVRYITPVGKKIRDNRHLFLSKKARFTHEGYSHAQLKRIRSHRNHLLNPPKKKPERADFGLPDYKLIPGDQLQAAENAIKQKIDEWEIDFLDMEQSQKIYVKDQIAKYMLDLKIGSDDKYMIAAKLTGGSDNFIELMMRERKYRVARNQWRQYQEWKINRNPKRAKLEEKYLMDTKHASHLYRLYSCCREILETGDLSVYRGDAEELIAIKNGSMTYEELIEFVEKESKEIAELYKTSDLQHSPDRNKLDNLCVEIIEEFYT